MESLENFEKKFVESVSFMQKYHGIKDDESWNTLMNDPVIQGHKQGHEMELYYCIINELELQKPSNFKKDYRPIFAKVYRVAEDLYTNLETGEFQDKLCKMQQLENEASTDFEAKLFGIWSTWLVSLVAKAKKED